MGSIELLLLAVGLAMDAFAVSVCKGLAVKEATAKEMAIAGVWFGGFQAFMPVIGYVLGTAFEEYIVTFDHWIAFILLLFIGGKMIKESFSDEEDDCTSCSFAFSVMLVMAIATSIDALAVGITFAFLNVNLLIAVALIGIITFIMSAVGIKIGNIFGTKYKSKAEFAGGIILILIGTKILLEHLGVL